MKEPCIDIEQIATVLEMPETDPRRIHIESCPRCRNLARSYAEFVLARTGPEARPEVAREHLTRVILEGTGPASVRPQNIMESRKERVRPSLWSSWRLRSAGLVAATVITILAVELWPERPNVSTLLRSSSTSTAGAMHLRPAETVAAGTVRLTWTRAPGANRYEVRAYNSELDEIYRHPAVADTSVLIRLSEMRTSPGSPGVIWRVHAFRGDDVIAISPPGSIPLR